MRNIFFLIVIMLSSITILFSQNNNKIKNKPLSQNTEVGDNYQFMSFSIVNLNSETERQSIIDEFSNNLNVKNFILSEHNQLSAYVDKSYILQFKSYFKDRNIQTTMLNKTKPLSQNEGNSTIIIPEDMKPKYIDTGNPKEDQKRYTEAKKKLLENHPEYIQK